MREGLRNPVRLVPSAFFGMILVGTCLLLLPISRTGEGGAPFLTALFTATSAVCVTGLIVEDTPVYWSIFGQAAILVMMQVGGLGIMTGAALLGLLVTRELRLSRRLVAQAETKSLALGDVTAVLRLVLAVTLAVEAVAASILIFRLHFTYGEPWRPAIWNGIFHAVSAFNNAGFSTYSNNLASFATDPIVLGPIMLAVIIGGLGLPVLHELRREFRQPLRWSIHTKLTLWGSAGLLAFGFVAVLVTEWGNPQTLGSMQPLGKMLNAVFHSVVARTAGFNTLDVGQMRPETLMITNGLMLIGGGSAGTAGGIKVTTFLVLGCVAWAEIRGQEDATAFRRRISPSVHRQALTVILFAFGLVGIATLLLLSLTSLPLDAVLFEVTSAFGTVGLSTGITGDLPTAAQLVLIVLMFLGRAGTITVAAALALRSRNALFRYPEERPIVG